MRSTGRSKMRSIVSFSLALLSLLWVSSGGRADASFVGRKRQQSLVGIVNSKTSDEQDEGCLCFILFLILGLLRREMQDLIWPDVRRRHVCYLFASYSCLTTS